MVVETGAVRDAWFRVIYLGDSGLHNLNVGGGGGLSEAEHQGILNKERAMEREGF
ncbi:hypothetical protein HG826_13300 [Streptomyces sp. GMY01]|uniref:hypothetical protein n=1 Tax=Streptomyces sp. GMY02 TaxID=1333528 RepID=UPI00146BA01C|nr:hypothetical protein [Streptomyces sp. GMY02]NMO34546.1 hypothetical protein [Streptomyces sp. GMY02]